MLRKCAWVMVGIVFTGGWIGVGPVYGVEGLQINEVASKEAADWIELEVLSSGRYGGYEIWEGGAVIAALPDWDLAEGDFIVIHEESGVDDLEKADNCSEWWDLYGAGSLVGTDNVIQIRNPEGGRVDAVIWSNNNGGFSGNRTEANAVVAEGGWLSAEEDFSTTYDAGGWIDSDEIEAGFSLSRIGGDDSDSAEDWEGRVSTLGGANSENEPPVAAAGDDLRGVRGEEIYFDGSESFDPEGGDLEFWWDFGDGQSGIGSEISHLYEESGNFVVELRVRDQGGLESQDQLEVNIENDEVIDPATWEGVYLSEIMPNPEGADESGEWIELYNDGYEAKNLQGLKIDDAEGGSSPYTFGGEVIESGEYLVVDRPMSGLALNNDADEARLLEVDGQVAETVSYSAGAEGQAYALAEGEWSWTNEPTPGAENMVDEEGRDSSKNDSNEEEASTETNSSSSTDKDKTDAETNENSQINPKVVSCAQAKKEAKNEWLKVQGVVTAPPGLFSETYLYIQDETGGFKVYYSKKEWPKIEFGSVVAAIGKKSETKEGHKINLADPADIQVVGESDEPAAESRKTGEVSEVDEGKLVIVSGKIIRKTSTNYYLDDGSGELKVYFDKDLGLKPEWEKEETVTVAGIVGQTDDGVRLMPRKESDLGQPGDEIVAAEADQKQDFGEIPEAGADLGVTVAIISGILAAGGIGYAVWMRVKKNRQPKNIEKMIQKS